MESIIARSEFEKASEDLKRNAEAEIFGEKVGLLARIFGCHHPRMSRPVTTENITYRFCPTCGIRRRYNLETFKAEGAYYYPAKTEELHHV